MADVTISSLDPLSPLGSHVLPISDGTTTGNATIASLPVDYNNLTNKPTIPAGVPVGAVFHIATSTTPAGYLICNGNSVPNGNGTVQGITADYSALFSVLGSTYGSAGSLPDLRGEFIRGWDNGRNIDPSRAFGSYQKATVQPFNTPFNENYVHGLASGNTNGSLDPAFGRPKIGLDPADKAEYPDVNSTAGPGNAFNTGNWINDTHWGGGAIRPRNLALLPVIKY